MSVSHPYLKQLKVYVLKLCEDAMGGVLINDSHSALLPLCQTLEDILVNGMRHYTRADGGHWKWAKILGDIYPTYKLTAPLQWCIDETAATKHVQTDLGRARLFIRCTLKKGVLALALRLLREDKKLLRTFYDSNRSIVGDEVLFELFASMVAPLAQCHFSLSIKNTSFLDETWDLPLYVQHELVPTDRLGVGIALIKGRVVVTDIEPGSVADEDAKIEPGDVIDYLYGECMRNGSRRKFITLMRDYKGAPVYIGVVKAIGRDQQFFKPLIPLITQAGLTLGTIMSQHSKRHRELQEYPDLPSESVLHNNGCADSKGKEKTEKLENTIRRGNTSAQLVDEKGCYPVCYVGQTKVGATGTIDKIERGVLDVLRQFNALSEEEKETKKRRVLIDLGETDVLVVCAKSNEPLSQHGYPEIASCGRRVDYPLNFAYIAGETTCTLAKEFTCYVFEANSDEQAKLILKEIARGFDRTHWAV